MRRQRGRLRFGILWRGCRALWFCPHGCTDPSFGLPEIAATLSFQCGWCRPVGRLSENVCNLLGVWLVSFCEGCCLSHLLPGNKLAQTWPLRIEHIPMSQEPGAA